MIALNPMCTAAIERRLQGTVTMASIHAQRRPAAVESARRALLQKRASLLGLHANLIQSQLEVRETTEGDLEDIAEGRTSAAVLTQLDENEVAGLDRIERALVRLEAGEYGSCASCGGKIAPTRLAVLPEAETCASCAPAR